MASNRSLKVSLLLLFLVTSCAREHLQRGEGYIDVEGGKIWYNVTGEGTRTPILLLHGGPGYPSYYLKPLNKLGRDRPVIRFDQLGCGRSDPISDTTLMTIDHYVEQVKEVMDHLNINEFYLYGHSWGSMLATDFYLKYPEKVKGLILASPCLDAKRWIKDADALINTLPDSTALVLKNNIKGIPQEASTLRDAVQIYLDNFVLRKKPIPADVDSSAVETGTNVYIYMWGENEFFATGTLKDYDRTHHLDKITVPTLYVAGEFDEAQPSTVKYYHTLTPNSRFEIIASAGHLTMHDNPNEDLEVLSSFLNENDFD